MMRMLTINPRKMRMRDDRMEYESCCDRSELQAPCEECGESEHHQ